MLQLGRDADRDLGEGVDPLGQRRGRHCVLGPWSMRDIDRVCVADEGPVDDPAEQSGPNREALIRLVGAVLAEQHDEWAEGRRYLGLDILSRSQLTKINNDTTKEAQTPRP